MVFEGKGKATWRDHPSINVKGNFSRAFPGLKIALIGFGIYVFYDQVTSFIKKRKRQQKLADISTSHSVINEHDNSHGHGH